MVKSYGFLLFHHVKTIVNKFLLCKNQLRKILEISYKTGVWEENLAWTPSRAEQYTQLLILTERLLDLKDGDG